MEQIDALRLAFRDDVPLSRRAQRAARTRAQALSPVRILLSLLAVPFVASALTVSIYVRTSPYEPPDALRHLLALSGCEAAAKFNLAPAYRGELGYHPRNDADGDGVACGSARLVADWIEPSQTAENRAGDLDRVVGGAKFLRP